MHNSSYKNELEFSETKQKQKQNITVIRIIF